MANLNIEKLINDALSKEADALQELSLDDLGGVAGGADIPGMSRMDVIKLQMVLKALKQSTNFSVDGIIDNLPTYYDMIAEKIPNVSMEQLQTFIRLYWNTL